MERQFVITLTVVVALAAFLSPGYAQTMISKSVVPLPPTLKDVPVIKVEPWVQVDAGNDHERRKRRPRHHHGRHAHAEDVSDADQRR